MADGIKGKLEEAGHDIAETATKVGHKVGEAAERASDYAKEKGTEVGHRASELGDKAKHMAQEQFGSSSAGAGNSVASVREHMDVICSCGTKLGVVDHLEGDRIKLTRKDSADGLHHYIPTSWISKVDSHVHLSKNSVEAKAGWTAA